MIQIRKIAFKNFIPYYGIKEFNFGEKLGTSIIFGNNNTGKTSFINGIRFLFFDYLKRNPDEPNFRVKLSMNKVAFDNQDYDFYVYMEFIFDGSFYKLKREYRADSNVIGEPKSDDDFDKDVTLMQDEKRLSNLQISDLIHKILPEDISEFMLFDGENIEKYIEILNNDSQNGVENLRVKEAINKIIGTPYIDSIIVRLENIRRESEDRRNALLAKRIGNEKSKRELEEIQAKIREKTNEKNDLKKCLNEWNDELEKIEKEIQEHGRNEYWFEQLTQNENKLQETNGRITSKKEDLKKEIERNIRSMQYEKIQHKLDEFSGSISPLISRRDRCLLLKEEIRKLNGFVKSNKCSYCGSLLSLSKHQEYERVILESQNEISSISLSQNENQIIEKTLDKIDNLKIISKQIHPFDFTSIKSILEEIVISEMDRSSYQNEIKKIKDNLKEDENDVKKFFRTRYEKKSQIEAFIKDSKSSLDNLDIDIDKLSSKSSSITKKIIPGIDDTALENDLELVSKIQVGFQKARDCFLESMREKVEKSASEIFLKFIENLNNDIERIQINDNYRMKICMKNGTVMPIPGTGYNTLLALSLIFGLNSNSQLFGTIFFDAAFSVLQNSYTNNIISTFNQIAPQLILLIHNDKIDINSTRSILGSKLVNEIEIYQDGNSFITLIRRK